MTDQAADPVLAARHPADPVEPPRAAASGAAATVTVVLLTVLGAVLRLVLARQPLFADELSTWWIVDAHGLRGVVSTVSSDAEITPPLFFVLAWFGRQASSAPEALRAPSWIAGIALIPLVYALGVRTVGRPAALLAAALTALGPFAIYYSADARGYALMMAAVVLSTLALLLAVDTGRRRWWVVHALALAVAVYAHYTCVFAFAAQLGWVLWAHPDERRRALAATAAAVVLFAPWAGGLRADLDSPTTKILAALSPFDWASARFSLTHWAFGYPTAIALPLRDFPGTAPLVLLLTAAALTIAGVLVRAARARDRRPAAVDRRLVLIVLLALSAPVAEAALNVVGTHLFSVRNFASSWPAATLAASALLIAPGRRIRVAAVALTLAAFVLAAGTLVRPGARNPDYRGAARFVDREAAAGDVVVDATGEVSPGPPTGLDLELARPHRLVRALAPEVRDHPFTVFDPIVPLPEAIRRAVAAAGDHRIITVTTRFPEAVVAGAAVGAGDRASRDARLPPAYRLVRERSFGGVLGVEVRVYARSPA